jgi:hypothetical protein
MFRISRTRYSWFGLPLTLGVAWLGVLHFAPWYYVSELDNLEIKEEEDERRADALEETVISYGEGALPYVIPKFEGTHPFHYSLPMSVLRRIGQPAHSELLNRVAATKGTATCIGYVYALQEAFGDFSQTDYWIEQIRQHPIGVGFLQNQLFKKFGGSMPPILNEDRQVSSDFDAWWAKHRVR